MRMVKALVVEASGVDERCAIVNAADDNYTAATGC